MKINERICLNGQPVSDEEFLRAFEKVKTTVDEMAELASLIRPILNSCLEWEWWYLLKMSELYNP